MPGMNLRPATLVLVILLGVAACSGRGGPPKRINPPAASLQEIAVQADGSWLLQLRVQSYSTFGQVFHSIDLDLVLDGAPVGRLQPTATPREIPGRAADVFRISLQPDPLAVRALERFAAAGSRSLVWTMTGSMTVDGRVYRNEFEGRLSPVPGLSDTYR